MTLLEKINWHCCHYLKYHYPFLWSKILYKDSIGRPLNLSDPRDINQKILWLSFFTDTSLWTTLADKYAVRRYVLEKAGGDVLVPLLGKWDNADNIDFSCLPNKFVLKPNNGCYDSIIVKGKGMVNVEQIRQRLNASLKRPFGLDNAEPHYRRINPCIIAEELLETNEEGGLKDYKIWCFHGEPHSIFLIANRDESGHADFMSYDLQWNRHPEWLTPSFRNDSIHAKPKNLDVMLELASKLSANIPQVRVDLYNLNGKIYFGELTFTSNFGMMPYFTQEFLNEMGNQCVLPNRSLSEKVKTLLNRWTPFV